MRLDIKFIDNKFDKKEMLKALDYELAMNNT